MSWRESARCASDGADLSRWFDSVEDPDTDETRIDEAGLAFCRGVCFRCPVRIDCLEDVMNMERGYGEKFRFGVRGGLTPDQRASLWRRDGEGDVAWRCSECADALDPRGLITGWRECWECGPDGTQPGLSDLGDQWADRHTRLAFEVRGWLWGYRAGDLVPSPTAYAREHGVRKDDAVRVYRAFLEEGLLVHEAKGVYRRL